MQRPPIVEYLAQEAHEQGVQQGIQFFTINTYLPWIDTDKILKEIFPCIKQRS